MRRRKTNPERKKGLHMLKPCNPFRVLKCPVAQRYGLVARGAVDFGVVAADFAAGAGDEALLIG